MSQLLGIAYTVQPLPWDFFLRHHSIFLVLTLQGVIDMKEIAYFVVPVMKKLIQPFTHLV